MAFRFLPHRIYCILDDNMNGNGVINFLNVEDVKFEAVLSPVIAPNPASGRAEAIRRRSSCASQLSQCPAFLRSYHHITHLPSKISCCSKKSFF
jgi:hypothetical protein